MFPKENRDDKTIKGRLKVKYGTKIVIIKKNQFNNYLFY